MKKSLYSSENQVLLDLLRDLRHEAGVTQAEIAQNLGWPQSYISRYESGERRLDPVELRHVCSAMGISLTTFSKRFDKALERGKR